MSATCTLSDGVPLMYWKPLTARCTVSGRFSVSAFEVPLAFLMNPENHQIHSKEFRGMERSYYAMPFAERYIWGATAGILRVLYERIYLA